MAWLHSAARLLAPKLMMSFVSVVAAGSALAGAPQEAGQPAPVRTERTVNASVEDYRLGPGDNIRILVFQNPDLTLDTRVAEGGTITYPLIGTVAIGGMTLGAAERKIAAALKAGNFLKLPQVNIVLLQVHGNQVSVLGQVNRPGRFPLETFNTRVSGLLATAGGINGGLGQTGGGSDQVILSGLRDGKPFRKVIDITDLFHSRAEDDVEVAAGDVIYVPPAPVYYVYGEVQRPGSFRLRRGMTVQQALADGGGLTQRGTQRGLRIDRRQADGSVVSLKPALDDPIQPDDVLYIRASLF